MSGPYNWYIKNVQCRNELGREVLIHDFGRRSPVLTEQRLAYLLNEAYNRGRRDLCNELSVFLGDVQK